MAQKGRGTGRLARDVSECRRVGRRFGGGAEEVGRGVRLSSIALGYVLRSSDACFRDVHSLRRSASPIGGAMQRRGGCLQRPAAATRVAAGAVRLTARGMNPEAGAPSTTLNLSAARRIASASGRIGSASRLD